MECWYKQLSINVRMQCIANVAIHLKPLLLGRLFSRDIFNRPETMPTGTGDNGSDVSQAATENDAFIPGEAKGWFCDAWRGEQCNAHFVKHLTGQLLFLCVITHRCAPDIPRLICSRCKQTCCHQRTNRALSTKEQDTFLFFGHRKGCPYNWMFHEVRASFSGVILGIVQGIIKAASTIYNSARCLRQASFCNVGRLKSRCAQYNASPCL